MAERVLSKDTSVPADLVNKIKTYRKTTFAPTVIELLKKTTNSRMKTIIHGDFWSNNMMINDDDPGTDYSNLAIPF